MWVILCCLCAVVGSAAAKRPATTTSSVDEDRFKGPPLSLDLQSQECPQYYLLGQMKCSTTTLFKVRAIDDLCLIFFF